MARRAIALPQGAMARRRPARRAMLSMRDPRAIGLAISAIRSSTSIRRRSAESRNREMFGVAATSCVYKRVSEFCLRA
eukprot:11199083-Lingulodinium_polyedra.AAC.1